MTTKIIEIPVPQDDCHANNSKRPSVDITSWLNNDFSTYLNNEDAQALNAVPNSQTHIYRQGSASSLTSMGSDTMFNGLESDDFNACLYLDNDEEFLSPFSTQPESVPESASMEDLSTKLGNLRRPSMSGQKQEKEEDNEFESASSSASESDDDESEELLHNRKGIDEDYDPGKQESEEKIRPIKKTRLGIQSNDSFSSISSYSSGASSGEDDDEHEEDDFDEYNEDDEDPLLAGVATSRRRGVSQNGPKKYQQPASLRADDLTIGEWNLLKFAEDEGSDDVTFDIKILFGRRKIKYEIARPQKGSRHRLILAMDFPFNFISGLEFKPGDHMIIFQLSERPTFSKKEKGKCMRANDWTEGQATTQQRHYIVVEDENGFTDYMERLLGADRRLRQLAKLGLSNITEGGFPVETSYVPGGIPNCDWDKDAKATKHCEECKQNFCDVCDDVLHRRDDQKTHRRIPVQLIMKPLPPKPKKGSNKKRKKMNNDRCRCGTGATKGTLGEPCTGNRCPCFSNGKSCVNCGCKGCANPVKRNPRSPAFTSLKQSLSASF